MVYFPIVDVTLASTARSTGPRTPSTRWSTATGTETSTRPPHTKMSQGGSRIDRRRPQASEKFPKYSKRFPDVQAPE